MKLGVVVTDINQSGNVLETIESALGRGWQVRCFLTEDGVNLVRDDSFLEFSRDEKASFSMCEHSAERYCGDFDIESIGDAVVIGGQYQDAELVKNSERVLVF